MFVQQVGVQVYMSSSQAILRLVCLSRSAVVVFFNCHGGNLWAKFKTLFLLGGSAHQTPQIVGLRPP
jgi:hypothetical protein